MGKAAKRARSKRRMYFVKLAAESASKFESEYQKRLSSWAREIRKGGINLRNKPLKEAYAILNACGSEIYVKYERITYEVLYEQFNPSYFVPFERCVSNYKKLLEMGVLYKGVTKGEYYE